MKQILLFAFTLLLICGTASQGWAAVEVGAGGSPQGAPAPPTSGPTGGDCNWWPIKDSLKETESSGLPDEKACALGNSINARGKYQFIPTTQANMIQATEGTCHGHALDCDGANIMDMVGHKQCCAVQECLMDALLSQNQAMAKNDESCKALMGKAIHGCRVIQIEGKWKEECLDCVGTESGFLAGYHLGGPNACSGVRSGKNGGNGDYDGDRNKSPKNPYEHQGTSEAYYMCRHGGLATPGNCTPADYSYEYDEGSPPPTLTQQQLDSLTGSGDDGFINTGASIKRWWVGGLMLMAEQFTNNMAIQVEAIGQMLDAKHQLETQRLINEKTAEAHKDYHPSEQMCTFGTFSRDLLSTERHANLTRAALSQEVLQRDLGSGDSRGQTTVSDSLSRLLQFRKTFCEPRDDNNGLKYLCPEPGPTKMRNRDIDYTRTLDQPLSLDIDLTDDEKTDDEEAVFALIDNLFLHKPMPRISENELEQKKYQYAYQNMRSIIAMRGIARNSFSNLIALKTAAAPNETPSGPYFKALLKEFGIDDEEVEKLLGENPSYYAQMELLTKKIYQNPAFYANLYDKPANVERIRAAMRAIKLMNDRDIQAALMRREMLLSLMLELRLREKADDVYNQTEKALFEND